MISDMHLSDDLGAVDRAAHEWTGLYRLSADRQDRHVFPLASKSLA